MSANTATLPLVSPNSARATAYILLLIALPAGFWAVTACSLEGPAGFAMLALSAALFRSSVSRRFGSCATVIGLFVLVAVCHAALGYFMAGPTSISIWIGTAADRVYATAFLVVSTGILAMVAGYAIAIPRRMTALRNTIRRFSADDGRLLQAGRMCALAGTALMFAVYAAVGIVPMLVDSFGRARYLSGIGDEFMIYDWLAARALDLLSFGFPLVVASSLWRHKRLDWVVAAFSGIALLLPLRRANLLTALFLVLIIGALRAGNFSRRRIAAAAALVALYGVSQVLFVSFANLEELDVNRGILIAAGALPEIRDLGWTIELIGGERLHGLTFLQALVPVPSFLSDFSQTSSLRAITSRMIGLDMQRQTGGLRLTLAGEAYLNFDLFGPVLIGFFFGALCAVVEVAFRELRDRHELWAHFTGALIFVWTCFWLYLGGTQSAATLKIGSALLIASLWWAHRKSTSNALTTEGAA